MRIIFWGTPEYSVASLKVLNESKHDVIAVISQPDKKRSRGNNLSPSPVKQFAKNKNIPIYTPEIIKGNIDFIKILKDLPCDLFVVIAYGKILPKEILDIPKYGCWNAHASLLPRWRGAAPIQWTLMKGDYFTGVGIMRMEEGLDTGDLLVEETIRIDSKDNLISLSTKLSILSSKLFLTAITKLEKCIQNNEHINLTKQKLKGREIKYARMINKNDFQINWNENAIDIIRKSKALYPRANTRFRGKNLKIIKINIFKIHESSVKKSNLYQNILKPGIIIDLVDEGIVISTKSHPIILEEAKLEGKNISRKKQLIQQLKPRLGENFSD